MSMRNGYWFLLLCLCAGLAPLLRSPLPSPLPSPPSGAYAALLAATQGGDRFPGWPAQFQQRSLTQLPLSALELQFQKDFPGHIGRFSDGKREIILRWINQASRRLHPASDCFKANGYSLLAQPMITIGAERWSSFRASRGSEKLIVSERIHDAKGQQWSDVSVWYWAVQLGKTSGPWWAVTVAQVPEV